VAENPSKFAGAEAGGLGDTHNCSDDVIGLELDILGKEVDFRIAVGQGQARLSDIVPLARTICTEITNVVVESIRRDGDNIPCCKGCAACCNRYLVPLSVPEAFRFDQEVSAAPEDRRQEMYRASLAAARRILSQKPPKPFIGHPTGASRENPVDLNLVSNWYMNLNLPCPFLHKSVCSIYEQRPLACREHFVKGYAGACGGRSGTAEVVKMPVQLPNALTQLAGELEGASAEAIILPLTLVWCRQNAERANRTWPAAMMVHRFFEILRTMASKDSIAIVEYKEKQSLVSQKHIGQQQFEYIGGR
jgi:Fe-S-cluster containining protein